MENDNLKSIFDGFDPELSSDSQFITKLQAKLRAIEEVKDEVSSLRRRNRLSLMVASLAGFIAGVLMTVLFPVMLSMAVSVAKVFNLIQLDDASNVPYILAWSFAAVLTMAASYCTYQFAQRFHLSGHLGD